jgi:thiamine biosynthesis lipoprotein
MDPGQSPVAGTFTAIGTSNTLLVTEPAVLDAAMDVARQDLAALDRAVSRFREDSEVSRLARLAENTDTWYLGSELFIDHLEAACHAARISEGLVDFTVGSALIASGYDADLDAVRARPTYAVPSRPLAVPGWQQVHRAGHRWVGVPRGAVLDFGASAKAHAADAIADSLARALAGGFLVNLGGDIATSGTAPDGGWRVGIEDADGSVPQVVVITDQGIATSSTQLRWWQTHAGPAHHIVDPRTGRTAPAVWAQVTCVGMDALEANAASTAAVVLGEQAPRWLTDHGVAARLDRPDGTTVFTPGWPRPLGSAGWTPR